MSVITYLPIVAHLDIFKWTVPGAGRSLVR
jgi:hypothetical protein